MVIVCGNCLFVLCLYITALMWNILESKQQKLTDVRLLMLMLLLPSVTSLVQVFQYEMETQWTAAKVDDTIDQFSDSWLYRNESRASLIARFINCYEMTTFPNSFIKENPHILEKQSLLEERRPFRKSRTYSFISVVPIHCS